MIDTCLAAATIPTYIYTIRTYKISSKKETIVQSLSEMMLKFTLSSAIECLYTHVDRCRNMCYTLVTSPALDFGFI